jgi:hypothetical protein
MITYKQLAESIILENSNFKGEFWIQDNYVQSADSNIDMGHEAIVIQQAASSVLSYIGIDRDEPYLPDMDDEIYEAIQNDLPEEIKTQYADGDVSAKDCLKYYGKHILRNAKFDELVDAAYDSIDVRRFAMREWGWKAIRGNVVDTWNLAPEDLKMISSGLDDAYPDEIDTYSNNKLDEYGNKGPFFDIEVYSRGDYYNSVPLDLIGQHISKILPYRTFVKGQRITETGELVGRIKLKPKTTPITNQTIQKQLTDLSKKYTNYLDANAYAYDDHIKLEALLAKKTAPIGTGSLYMKELCNIADQNNLIITLTTATSGYGGFEGFKKTSSVNRLKRFYSRFGFVSNYSKRNYRPDLVGNMHRLPNK